MRTIFIRAIEADNKAEVLRDAAHSPELSTARRQRFHVNVDTFMTVPRSPFAYWVRDAVRRKFTEIPLFETEDRFARQGLATADDFRFVRCWWEVPSAYLNRAWFPFAKGGKFSPYYADVYLAVKWDSGGNEIKANLNEHGDVRSNVWMLGETASKFFLRPGLTWPRRTQGGLSLRAMPAGCVFADKGPGAFLAKDDEGSLLALLGIVNSKAFRSFVDQQMAFGSYEVGVIQRTPVPSATPVDSEFLAARSRRMWALKRTLDTIDEGSHAFTLPALLQIDSPTLGAGATTWAEHIRSIEKELAATQAEIDARCFELYDMDVADQRSATEVFNPVAGDPSEPNDEDAEPGPDEDCSPLGPDAQVLAGQVLSWAIGVAFGRFDARLATGERGMPTDPGPFDPLPACSVGMLVDAEGLPARTAPTGYPIVFPRDGILVDDPGHRLDLVAAVRAVFDRVFGNQADAWWSEAGALVDPKERQFRTWLRSGFLEHHIKNYSKSRRKAPILWQLGIPSGRYSVWLYAHRLTNDTLFAVQNDVVAAKLAHEERQLLDLLDTASGSTTAKQRREISAQESLVEELRAFLDDLKRVAPLWYPHLEDGVVVTMAPLWRLVPQNKSWQKELKTKWDALAAGKLDWAHTAMHLWPERVVPNCATDRSFAIAHGLEDVFWVEGDGGKWVPRETPTRTIEDLIAERSSPAVKSALKGLLDSMPDTPRGRRRREEEEGAAMA